MRILDENFDKSLENVTLYLTFSEASELRDGLDDLLKKPFNNHIHLSEETYQKGGDCLYL